MDAVQKWRKIEFDICVDTGLKCASMHSVRRVRIRVGEMKRRSKRTASVWIRFTPEEKKDFEELAMKLGTSLSDLIRTELTDRLRTEKRREAA